MSLIDKTPTDQELDRFRTLGDPLADAAVEELIALGAKDFGGFFKRAKEEDGPCRSLHQAVHAVPDWVDFDVMGPGSSMAYRNLLPNGLSLLCACLIESFIPPSVAAVLVRSGRLMQNPARRLFETAVFANDMALCQGPVPGSDAFYNAVHVRLMHAWIRRQIRHDKSWDESAFGLPVNQEDYVSTLLVFSHVYSRAVKVMGVRMSEAQRLSVHHAWQYAGYVMGVDECLLTRNPEQEAALYTMIARRQFHPNDDSKTLVKALIQAMAGRSPYYLPEGMLFEISRAMIGDELADKLDFPLSNKWSACTFGLISQATKMANSFGKLPALGFFIEKLGRASTARTLRRELGDQGAPFSLPKR